MRRSILIVALLALCGVATWQPSTGAVLSTLPYKARITSRTAGGGGTWKLNVDITNQVGIIRRTVTINVPADWEAIRQQLREQLHQTYVLDAGSVAGFVDAAITNGTLIDP